MGDKNYSKATPTLYNVTCTNANTEYSQAITNGTKHLSIRCRTGDVLRLAFVTGKVATPTAPYITIPAGASWESPPDLDTTGATIFLASPTAGVVAEVEEWT
jgi:hypothetical protein